MRLALAAAVLLACSAEPRGESRYAVAVLGANGTCSGTLIAPNLVLTARHCVAPDTGGASVDCERDRFLPPVGAESVRVSTQIEARSFADGLPVANVLVPSASAFCGNDIALLVLASNADGDLAVPALDADTVARTGTTVTAVGYGTSAPGADDEGVRRRHDGVAVACIPGDPTRDCTPGDFAMTDRELALGDGLCEGDSGSGAFVLGAGAPTVIGVVSRSTIGATSCTDAVYTRTDAFAAFLRDGARDAARLGHYAVPSWAR